MKIYWYVSGNIKLITINGIILIINATLFKKKTTRKQKVFIVNRRNKQSIKKIMIWTDSDVNEKST